MSSAAESAKIHAELEPNFLKIELGLYLEIWQILPIFPYFQIAKD